MYPLIWSKLELPIGEMSIIAISTSLILVVTLKIAKTI